MTYNFATSLRVIKSDIKALIVILLCQNNEVVVKPHRNGKLLSILIKSQILIYHSSLSYLNHFSRHGYKIQTIFSHNLINCIFISFPNFQDFWGINIVSVYLLIRNIYLIWFFFSMILRLYSLPFFFFHSYIEFKVVDPLKNIHRPVSHGLPKLPHVNNFT